MVEVKLLESVFPFFWSCFLGLLQESSDLIVSQAKITIVSWCELFLRVCF